MSPPRASPTRLFTPAFAILSAATLAYFVADGLTLPVSPRFAAGPLGADSVGVGLSIGAFSVTALILRPWTGGLSDRYGRRPMMLVGSALLTASLLLHVVSVSLPIFIGARLLMGAAEAFVFVAAFAAAADLAPEERRGEAISLFSLALYVGIGVGPPIGESILAAFDYNAVWLAAAGIAVLSGLLALGIPDTRGTEVGDGSGGRLLHPRGVLPGLVLLAGCWGMAGYFAFVSLYALDLGLDGAAPYLSVYAAVVIGLRVVGAKLPDRIGARLLTTLSLLVGAAGLALIGLWADPVGLMAGTILFALGVAFSFPALSLLVVESVPASERGAVLGTYTAFLDIAFGLGPVTAGAVVASWGYGASFLVSAGVAVAGAVLLLAAIRPQSPSARNGSTISS
ncbi:MAG: MFS transporter [Chloroflexota bacterium]|nr:MFS transporter [Chloroflexota bacterium]